MEKVYAFTDESGSFGWQLDNETVSSHFIITAIIVRESQLDTLRTQLEPIRKFHFQSGEMKSSKIGANHNRRLRILNELLPLEFSIFPVIVDKAACAKMKGLRYKPSFYKFMNNIVHKELRRSFQNLVVVADEIGSNEYMKSFISYVKDREDVPDFFNNTSFYFENSTHDVIIQLADFISGTLSFCFDKHKISAECPDYKKYLDKKIIRLMLYPKTYETYILDTSTLAKEYDHEIASICFRQAAIFLEKNRDSDDPEIQAQSIVLEYLLFRFMNNDKRGYIPTKELINQLLYTQHEKISVSTFRLKIICKLRDAGVIIASSSKGYKIPAQKTELYDFINHGVSVAIPVLDRMKKCRDIIKMGTTNQVDLFDHTEYNNLKRYFDEL